ncbi:MAG: aminotransferase class V-fold PLP-dependent enzyme, partial [Pyrinomonadaceae bacterium]
MEHYPGALDRRRFLSSVGKGLGLAALSSSAVASLLKDVRAAAKRVAHLSAAEAARDEEFWFNIQQAFSVTRGLLNLNNGGVSPSPRIVTEALVRYLWQQEDATAYTMWEILEPQSETIRTGLADLMGCDREEVAITRNASDSLEALLFGLDLKPGDEVLTTTQDYPRMLTTLRQRERRDKIVLKLVKIPVPPKDPSEITAAYEAAFTPRTRLVLVSHMINLTGQITPVRDICELARRRGAETVVDGAHSFAQFSFRRDDLGCDYFGTSLHKWLHAPKGTGMLYVRKEKIKSVWPLFAAERAQDADIRKFEETGTRSAAQRLAIGEALLFHQGVGPERKEARLRFLARHWMNQLKNEPNVRFNTSFDDRQSCALANVEVSGTAPDAVCNYLMRRHKILAVPIVHDEFKGVRITPSVYTTLKELDRFSEVMSGIARKGLP